MSEEIKKEVQDAELNPEELNQVAGGSFVINGNEGEEKECQLCGKTFLSFGSNYCDACKWIKLHELFGGEQ